MSEKAGDLEAARRLASEIVAAGEAELFRSLVAVARDPKTRELLDRLAPAARQRADVYLRDAEQWETRQFEANRRRLREAGDALSRLDIDFADRVLGRVDPDFLDPEAREAFDRLLLDTAARSMEIDEMSDVASQVVTELKPQRRRWWKRG